MKYYIDKTGLRHAFNDGYDATAKIAELSLTLITDAEAREAAAKEQEAYKETDEYKLSTISNAERKSIRSILAVVNSLAVGDTPDKTDVKYLTKYATEIKATRGSI